MGSTARKVFAYGAGLIGLYLAVNYSSGFSRNVSSASSGGVNVIKALQGR